MKIIFIFTFSFPWKQFVIIIKKNVKSRKKNLNHCKHKEQQQKSWIEHKEKKIDKHFKRGFYCHRTIIDCLY